MEFSNETVNDLSNDQRLLLEYVLGISRGRVSPRFAAWKIGPLNHARWLTLSIRLMCLWTREPYPPELHDQLYQVIKFIVQVYAVSWFQIKRDSKSAAVHLQHDTRDQAAVRRNPEYCFQEPEIQCFCLTAREYAVLHGEV